MLHIIMSQNKIVTYVTIVRCVVGYADGGGGVGKVWSLQERWRRRRSRTMYFLFEVHKYFYKDIAISVLNN